MVLSPLSSDSSSFSPVPGCFSLGVLSVNNDITKRCYEMYMYTFDLPNSMRTRMNVHCKIEMQRAKPGYEVSTFASTARKCPSGYPIMKKSLAASASEQPVQQRKVKHGL